MQQTGNKFHWATAGIVIAIVGALSLPARAQDIWFAPPDDLPRGAKIFNRDFPQFWTSPDQWKATASHISVFGLNPYYAAVAPEEKLKAISAFLKAKHIALSVGMQSLPVEGCGQNVEGMTRAGVPGSIARRLKSFGIDVAYFSLDEPLYFGSVYTGKEACRYSIPQVAHRLAGTIGDLRAAYPDAKIVEAEPTTSQSLGEWTATLTTWLESYRSETGTPLYALEMDSLWQRPWQEADGATVQILHHRGIKAGIILDSAGGPGVTDESWMANAQKNAANLQAAKLDLDFVTIASWMLHPSHNLPESDPLALTSLVEWYVSDHSGVRAR
jgi:hypothetical protein